jgi:phosphoglycerate dehydrogenase-like enzyme
VRIAFAGAVEEVPPGEHFDVLLAPTLPWLPDVLRRAGSVRWIHFLSAGVDKIWELDFDKQAVLMTKSSGVHGPAMSEFAIGAILFFAKQFGRFWEQSREHVWQRAWLDELTGRTVTVLGLGHVGQAVAQRAAAFGMHVTGMDQSPRAVPGVQRVYAIDSLGDALSEADYVVVCLPLTSATRGLIDREAIGRIRRGGVLVDISRGGVVCQDAVLEALDAGQLSGAALDVFEEEPLPADSPLWGRPDVLLTPHVAGTTPRYLQRALDVFLANAERLLRGEPPLTPVDVAAGY